ncbi:MULTISPECIES: hemolysin family protein [unclassified Leptolyngbya]|uniref:hemolysin family protein n=1 Tax=unclassified Leptolyngbya TaxID=2650499 RepID=UPI001687D642|nr:MULTISPECIES: hemolysin family protein [unclassified Leptolyngbya]MBD1909705.1 HlyC/CorC family transporter [Leptolyngbya sp. FACHB-8]MBD2155971.1 HlyC/CorC family transporter [Leptolyngbya sp. FACHB-16]
MLTLLTITLAVICGSAICSCTETALLSVSMIKVRQWAQGNRRSAKALLAIREKINRPIATLVIFNNLFNILGSIVIGSLASSVLESALLGVFSGILTFLIIIFGEILPKTFGERFAEPISLATAIPLAGLTFVITPLIWMLEKVTAPLVGDRPLTTTNEAEIQFLTTVGRQEGVIGNDEAEMIHRVFSLNDTTAVKLMTPRVALTFIQGDSTLSDVQQQLVDSQHNRLIVIDETIDHVLGVALRNELLAAIVAGQGDRLVATLARPAWFIPDTLRADKLLRLFQAKREHLAVVVNEYGVVMGVVTLEDVLEVITGEIVDETDDVTDMQAFARRRRDRLLKSYRI